MSIKTAIIVTIFLALGTVVGCAPGTQPVSSTQPAAKQPEYLNVLEAVFRYQFDHNASALQQIADYFFLTLDESFLTLDKSDPPAELLERFRGHLPRVLPASMAKASLEEGVQHKELGGRGLIFRITHIAWLDASTVEIHGGYFEAGLSGSGNIYRVERRRGKWVVTKNEMQWIS